MTEYNIQIFNPVTDEWLDVAEFYRQVRIKEANPFPFIEE